LIIGTSLQYLVLVMLSDNWLVSTFTFTPCMVAFMILNMRTPSDNDQDVELEVTRGSIGLLVFRCVFLFVVYAAIAYRVELLQK
jgi:hypothetical protein